MRKNLFVTKLGLITLLALAAGCKTVLSNGSENLTAKNKSPQPMTKVENPNLNIIENSITVEGVTIRIPTDWVRTSEQSWEGKDNFELHFSVKTLKTEAIGNQYLSGRIERETQKYYKVRQEKEDLLDVRYMKIDSIKGIHCRAENPKSVIYWEALREYKGQFQHVSVSLSSPEGTFRQNKTLIYQTLNSIKFTVDEDDKKNSLAKKYYESGTIHYENRNYQQSLADLTKGIEITKSDYVLYDLLLLRARVLAASKRYDEEITDLTRLTELCSKINRELGESKCSLNSIYQDRAFTYSIKGDYQSAIADYTKAIELADSYPDDIKKIALYSVYESRGKIYQKLKQYDNALSDLTKMLELNDLTAFEQSQIYSWRGMIYSEMGEFEKAVNDFTKSLELNSKAKDTYQERAKAYRKLGKITEAESDEKIVKILKP